MLPFCTILTEEAISQAPSKSPGARMSLPAPSFLLLQRSLSRRRSRSSKGSKSAFFPSPLYDPLSAFRRRFRCRPSLRRHSEARDYHQCPLCFLPSRVFVVPERERERGAAASVAVTAFGKAELRKVASLPPPRRPLVPRRLGLRGHRCRCRHTHPSPPPPPPSLSVSSSGRGRLVAWLVEPCQSVCPPRSVRGAFHSLTRRRRTKARPPAEARTRRGGQY